MENSDKTTRPRDESVEKTETVILDMNAMTQFPLLRYVLFHLQTSTSRTVDKLYL